MSDTPRTDALMSDMSEGWPDRWAESHAQLECELADAQEELNDKRKFCYAVEQALDGTKGDYIEIIKELVAAKKSAEPTVQESLTVAERKPVPEFELIEKWEGE